MTDPIDIIICLGNGSSHGNDELRILLRSMERNASGIGRVFLATSYAPGWLDPSRLAVIDIDDIYLDNKDANLHRKTLEVVARYNVGRFCWLSDDVVFLKPVALQDIPILRGVKPCEEFRPDKIWTRRLCHTFDFARSVGVDIRHSYEVHAPQVFDGSLLLERMRGVDYTSQPGLTIFTAWRAVCGQIGLPDELPFTEWKETLSTPEAAVNAKLDRPFAGYNDDAFDVVGFRARLFRMFNAKSSYERSGK